MFDDESVTALPSFLSSAVVLLEDVDVVVEEEASAPVCCCLFVAALESELGVELAPSVDGLLLLEHRSDMVGENMVPLPKHFATTPAVEVEFRVDDNIAVCTALTCGSIVV